jgi:hypothetical protein
MLEFPGLKGQNRIAQGKFAPANAALGNQSLDAYEIAYDERYVWD